MKTGNLKELLAKHRFATICLGASLVFAGVGFYRSGSRTDMEQRLAEKSEQAERLRLNVANAAMLKEQTEQLIGLNERIRARSVSPGNLGSNLQYFYKMETLTGVKLLEATQTYATPGSNAKAAPVGSYVPVPYSISIEADYRSVLQFVRTIEKGTHIARFSTASFAVNGENTQGGAVVLRANVELLGTP